MTMVNPLLDNEANARAILINHISINDLIEIIGKGIDDFLAVPTHSIFVIIIYPVMGLILLRLSFGYHMLPVVFPLIAGFTLLGPFTAVGLYEISRRRELGLSQSWEALGVFSLLRIRPIAVLGIALTVIFVVWLVTAMALYENSFLNWYPSSFSEFTDRVFGTSAGWRLILVGCGVGFLFALLTFAISVVSFPMLVDRNVSAGVAVATSIRAVAANPITMAVWGLIVVAGLLLGFLPILVGLAVVLPVLGHSTWHLYRKLVQPEPGTLAQAPPRPLR